MVCTPVLILFPTELIKFPAGILNNHLIPFEWATDYATENLTLAAELRDNINFDPGFVALPYD